MVGISDNQERGQSKRICSSQLSFVRGFMAAGKEQPGNDSITEEDALGIVIIAQSLIEIFIYFGFKKILQI